MSDHDFVARVRDANKTQLSRLGSSKALYAETDGELAAQQVLRAAAVAEAAASETFAAWADDEADSDAAELFAAVADEEDDHHETVVAELEEPPAVDDAAVPAIQSVLREFETTIERAGGLVGRCLVAKQSKQQYTGYFVGDADPQTASVFRQLGEDVETQLDSAAELIARVCETEADRNRAESAASEAVQAAYEEYTATLNELGVDPKPVC